MGQVFWLSDKQFGQIKPICLIGRRGVIVKMIVALSLA